MEDLQVKRIRDLKGLGPISEKMLVSAGIDSVAVLKELGAIRAFIKVSNSCETTPSINLLYALVGALENRHWLSIAKRQKAGIALQLEILQEFEKLFQDDAEKL